LCCAATATDIERATLRLVAIRESRNLGGVAAGSEGTGLAVALESAGASRRCTSSRDARSEVTA
jgi:hypothetical protein